MFWRKSEPKVVTATINGLAISVEPKETLLHAALRQGVDFPYSCRVGGCATCKCRLLDGKVKELTRSDYILSDEELDQGYILACQSVPRSDISIAVALGDGPALRSVSGRVVARENLTQDIIELRIQLEDSLRYKPGQFAELALQSLPGMSRSYSFATAVRPDAQISFFVRQVQGGVFSTHVHQQVIVGDRVTVAGPLGNFWLRPADAPILLIAGGSGLAPILALLEYLEGKRPRLNLVRTYARVDGQVRYFNNSEPDIPFAEVGTPTWDGLPLDRYLSLLDMLNPMNRLWSDGRWNKLTVAHGCYWKKCSFCDVSLDYISRYETAQASTLVDRIEQIVAETGQTGFHFVDEAAPPKALKALAEELLRRGVQISWWGNIRFEKTFTPELCELLAQSGCIAMSGGLEVASDRLLQLMKKGVSVEQVAQVTKGFADAGVLVHAYLMYGFPTQTVQDTVDALEYVRQLFENGCIHSGFFHRFVCTVHSPVGQNPEAYGVKLLPLPDGTFAKNDVGFVDPTPMPPGVDHDLLGQGLKKAIYNFMHGVGVEADVRQWFELPKGQCPKPTVPRHKIAKALG